MTQRAKYGPLGHSHERPRRENPVKPRDFVTGPSLKINFGGPLETYETASSKYYCLNECDDTCKD
jgi:hypothetical protein